MLEKDEIRRVATNILCRKSINYEIIDSKSTESMYLIIKNDVTSLMIRFSDHTSSKNIRSFGVNKKYATRENVERFINNAIRSLSIKTVYQVLA